ncbi:hypothetical protein NJB1907f44_43590 [Mycobacterium marinum]|uniref:DUF5685 family protein n=1 Tax=Mycobacterium marinum TaxID=1781 RepID=UPI0021C46DD7|nr:DUF5685 family protein [Mycobacterium marinum]GJN96392.1 hypothetical protein NJB1907E8_45350 [Mycobacterium marinum]GJO08649.1 hypothetical protein NJB1808e29_41400 [Mycobacterium marinum]GJO11414.1 hypothetical protein NJB1907f34b_44940 [Mycobacterium marinum]GJO16084.1 hypothetical protein NJB1728e18_09380 [Mycobacterium marinum]GJO18375.1 hypothetical protein NJB1907E90_47550 [Mycobacterium marinum]
MFGIIRPCRHRLGRELTAAWRAQLCGLCLALRDDYGQAARIATNYDGLVVSVLVEAQSMTPATRRTAGPCPLRGMRRADVATGECARLAAVVSLALAAARVRDHIEDRDGVVGATPIRPTARRIAQRWVRQGTDAGNALGFDTNVLVAAMDRQAELEANAVAGSSLLLVTEPTETAVAAAFEHTAVLAQRPANQAPLREIGRLFGRIAHLLDAVADYHDDLARGKWNPLTATATSIAAVRPLCDDALLGIELALADVDFTDGRLARRLLTREVRLSVSRTFSQLGYAGYEATPHGRQEPINFGAQPMSAGPYPGLPGEPAPNPDQNPKRGCWNTCTEDCCCDCTCDCCCEGCCDGDCCCDCGDCCDCCDCGDCCDCS